MGHTLKGLCAELLALLLCVAAMALHRLAFVVLLFAPAVGRIRTPDLDALLELFKFMGGMHWDRNEGWDPEGQTDPCNFDEHWFGVGCIDPCDIYRDGPDCKAGRVTALTLRKNNLTGSITNWTSVKHLANLTWLDMSMNRISGTLPAEFGYIQNIVHLNMRENKLQGQIPPEMGDINSNGYEQLTEFNFARNNLEGTIPSTLAKLTDLMMLDVSHNKITGSIPNELTNLTKLQVLYLQSNNLDGEMPVDIGNLKELRFLNGSTNNISGSIPASIGGLRDLQELNFFENRITGEIPLSLGDLWNLRSLRFHDNEITANISRFTTLGNLGRLVTLDFYNNKMVGDVPASIQNLTSLQYLYLQNEHYLPLRKKYCRQRLPNNGKYNYRIVRDEYVQMMAMHCEDMHDTRFTFNSLQQSNVYPSE